MSGREGARLRRGGVPRPRERRPLAGQRRAPHDSVVLISYPVAVGPRVASAILAALVGVPRPPAAPAVAQPGESIAAYDTRIVVAADGRIQVTETIRYDFGLAAKHGIFRRIPATFRYDDTHNRVYPVEAVS